MSRSTATHTPRLLSISNPVITARNGSTSSRRENLGSATYRRVWATRSILAWRCRAFDERRGRRIQQLNRAARFLGPIDLCDRRRAQADFPNLPEYEILAELGHGGMGIVYKARHRSLNRLVALKMIRAGSLAKPEDLARFRVEAEAVAKLRHPNIIQIYDIGEHNGLPFVALELLEAGSLGDLLRGTPQTGERSAAIVATLARAVHAAHEAGIIHRDLKPSNVLFASEDTPKVTDFGLAKRLEESGQTETGQVLGSPSYIPPEQAQGRSKEVGPTADVYALGAILYETLTGRPPFKGTTPIDTVMQVLHDEPLPPSRLSPHVPRNLETICLKCLAKEPLRRYPTAVALAEDLERYLVNQPIRAPHAGLGAGPEMGAAAAHVLEPGDRRLPGHRDRALRRLAVQRRAHRAGARIHRCCRKKLALARDELRDGRAPVKELSSLVATLEGEHARPDQQARPPRCSSKPASAIPSWVGITSFSYSGTTLFLKARSSGARAGPIASLKCANRRRRPSKSSPRTDGPARRGRWRRCRRHRRRKNVRKCRSDATRCSWSCRKRSPRRCRARQQPARPARL